MSDKRQRGVDWTLPELCSFDSAQLAVLMDIRGELKQLNGLLGCQNFIDVPHILRHIRQNTEKPIRRKPRRKKAKE